MHKLNYSPFIIAPFIIFMIYYPGLSGPLMVDDWPQLMPIINDINNDNWTTQYKQFILSNSGVLRRPISMMTFIFNAATSGKDIWHWKLTNVLLHTLCGLSIFVTTKLLLSFNNRNNKKNILYLSSIISLTWLLHPLHVSTVLYLVQRMTILSTLFTMCALTCYLYGFKNELNSRSGVIALLVSTLIFLPLALFSKENAALFPIYILLLTLYVINTKNITITQLPKTLKIYNILMLLLVLLGLFVLLHYREPLIFNSYNSREFTILEHLLTESRVLIYYMTLIISPLPSNMGFFHDDFIISKNLLNPPETLISIISIASLIYMSVIKFKNHSIAGFGVLFFLASHLLESSIFPLEIAFEHRNYIGMWGLIITLSYLLTIIKYNEYIFITILLLLSSLTLYRSSLWKNSNIMYPYMLSIHPHSKRLNIIHAQTYASAEKYDTALNYLTEFSGLGFSLQRLHIKCSQYNKLDTGRFINLLNNEHIKIGTYEMEGIISIANLGLDNKCLFSKIEFTDFLSDIVKLTSMSKIDLQKIYIYQAHYYHDLGFNDKSINALQNSFFSYKNNPIPLFLMTEWLIEYNRTDNAKMTFTKAKQVAANSFYDYSDFINKITPLIY